MLIYTQADHAGSEMSLPGKNWYLGGTDILNLQGFPHQGRTSLSEAESCLLERKGIAELVCCWHELLLVGIASVGSSFP